MTLAQMQKVIEGLPPVFRKLKDVVETLRVQVAAIVDNRTVTLTTVVGALTNGTQTVQLTFADANGTALTEPLSGWLYVSEVATGLTINAWDAAPTASKGVLTPNIAADYSMFHFITNATGELDLTVDSNDDSYWMVFPQGNGGRLLISDEIVVTTV
jgi:hypothetical protein